MVVTAGFEVGDVGEIFERGEAFQKHFLRRDGDWLLIIRNSVLCDEFELSPFLSPISSSPLSLLFPSLFPSTLPELKVPFKNWSDDGSVVTSLL